MPASRPVLRFGNRCLRAVCAPLAPGGTEADEVLDALWETLEAGDGVGLAAPQIGILRRALVVRDQRPRHKHVRLELVNPVITSLWGEERFFEEGCLSFPGLYLPVRRPQGVAVDYFDRQGRERTLRDRDLVARIVQHEVDHLDGRLFIDHLSPWRKLVATPRLWAIRLGGLWKREADCR